MDWISGDHQHCDNCFKTKCRMVELNCPIISCSLGCGAAFHQCKRSEHQYLCPLEKVNCINFCNGCPAELLRCDVAHHLEYCPASIVCCTLEWCRWPVYSQEYQKRVPFGRNNLRARCGQLDVALAFRDQRAILKARTSVPRSVLQSLRNPMTPQFPTVPVFIGGRPGFEDSMPAEEVCLPADDSWDEDCSDAPWIKSKDPPGLLRSICQGLFGSNKMGDSEPLDKAAEVQMKKPQNVATDVKCSLCTKIENDASLYSLHHSSDHSEMCDVRVTKLEHTSATWESSPCLHSSQTMTDGCQNSELELCGLENPKIHHEELDSVRTQLGEVSRCTQASSTVGYVPDTTSADKIPIQGICQGSDISKKQDQLSESFPPALHEVLAVDLNMEMYSRETNKPRSVYTFMCGQMFRRDAYMHHVRDVHVGLINGLSDWVTHRCPLAQYGCTFSLSRFKPDHGSIIFSPLLESFGLKMFRHNVEIDCSGPVASSVSAACTIGSESLCCHHVSEQCATSKEPTPELLASKDFDSVVVICPRSSREPTPADNNHLSLLMMPSEVLVKIVGFLDSFSLCNLSLTCWHMRHVCELLLSKRGLVVQVWKRSVTSSGAFSWNISHKCWMFSTAFHPVHRWVFQDQSAMYRHLTSCPFYVKCSLPEKPFALIRNGEINFCSNDM